MGTKMICGFAAVVCLAAGCGGGSSGDRSTANSAASTPSTAAVKPKPTKHELMTDALWRFLGDVKPIRVHFNKVAYAADAADRKVTADYSTWDAAARANQVVVRIAPTTADKLAAIVAPAALGPAYRAYISSFRAEGFIDSDLAATLSSHTYFNWDTYNARYSASEAPVSRFRVALIQYAAVYRLSLPRWVHKMGG